MPSKRKGLDHRAYRRAKNKLRKESSTCWLCGNEIDRTLPPEHPESWTADHIDPLSKGGRLLGELRAAHRSCNSRRGNTDVTELNLLPTSRQW
ncbi:HNH endonuclease [Nocardia transvalensis]|uniref:HNH endonuclease n=1 Tax=Nocardia transvalensis TaxID=37333 RepID=UPI003A5D0701